MSPETYERTVWVPTTEEEKAAVRQQMHRLLQTSHFRNSKRYPALFRFIVEEALEGRGEFLKERLLGVRVFERPADYDTASDPIVRVTVAEIRKRIAQYYHEEAHETEMRIELLPGSYEPEFRPRQEPVREEQLVSPVGSSAAEPSGPPTVSPATIRTRTTLRRAVWIGVACLLFGAAGMLGWRWMHPSAIDEFWSPILSLHRPVTICVPRAGGAAALATRSVVVAGELIRQPVELGSDGDISSNPDLLQHESLGENVVFSDVSAAMHLSDLLASRGTDHRLRMSATTSLDDLHQGPAILVGGMDNLWALHAIEPLPFGFAGSDEEGFWIADKKDLLKKDWIVDLKKPLAELKRDYAIVARVHEQSSGQIEVVVAGIGMTGTAAAGEFLSDPQQMEELRRRVGAGFRNSNFEVILSTDVVNGISGSAQILKVSVW